MGKIKSLYEEKKKSDARGEKEVNLYSAKIFLPCAPVTASAIYTVAPLSISQHTLRNRKVSQSIPGVPINRPLSSLLEETNRLDFHTQVCRLQPRSKRNFPGSKAAFVACKNVLSSRRKSPATGLRVVCR